MINTSEQFGGALGIAVLAAVEVTYAKHETLSRLADRGIIPTQDQVEKFTQFLQQAEQHGIKHVKAPHLLQQGVADSIQAHVDAFRLVFYISAGIALVGALACLLLVRGEDRVTAGPIFSRRSRWLSANVGRTPGITRHPPPDTQSA